MTSKNGTITGTNIATYSNLAKSREYIYLVLSRLYARPINKSLLELLQSWGTSQKQSPLADFSRTMKQGLKKISLWFDKHYSKSSEVLIDNLNLDFTQLFRGVNCFCSPPPPYESVYREDSRLVFSELSFKIQNEYRSFGFDIVEELKGEPPDHISFEFEFMHLLSCQEAKAWGGNNRNEALRLLKKEKQFLEEHLIQWVPAFCENIRKFDASGLYSGLADLTEGWVYYDLKLIDGSISIQKETDNNGSGS